MSHIVSSTVTSTTEKEELVMTSKMKRSIPGEWPCYGSPAPQKSLNPESFDRLVRSLVRWLVFLLMLRRQDGPVIFD